MIFTFIGFLVGIVMGLTGAGGAIIAIPLFQLLLGSSIKEATVLSLITVVFGTIVNLTGKTKEIKWKIAFGFALFGTIANFLSLPLKSKTPDMLIALLLLIIGTFSIWSIWNTKKPKQMIHKLHLLKVPLIGALLGVVTTLTGLGGGVLLMPILLNFFGMTYEEALPTSLSSIALISFSALAIQGYKTNQTITAPEVGLIALGALIGFMTLKFALKLLSDDQKTSLRKVVFSFATVCSLIIVLIKTF